MPSCTSSGAVPSSACTSSLIVLDPLYQGDDKFISISFADSDSVAYDLTGSTITFTLKENRSGDVVYEDIQTDVDMLNPVGGLVQFTIESVVSETLSVRGYVYDVLWELANGGRFTFMSGSFDVLAPIHAP